MAQLIMNRMDSRCGNCNESADPGEDGHYTILGYVKNGEPGCGEEWDSVSSDYINLPEQMIEWHFNKIHLIGLPVYSAASKEPIGLFGGQTRENAQVSELREEEYFSISSDNDLREL